jgi:biphenyl-2,3-diol 1,2-dioxygenase
VPIELAYLGVEVTDVPGLTAVLEGVAGLVPGESHDGVSTWRNDDRAQRILVAEGPADDATVIGFEAASRDDAAEIAERLAGLGYDVAAGGADECAARRVEGLWTTVSPWGTAVEIVHGLATAGSEEPFRSDLVPGGFKTDGVGFGHCVFMVADAETAHKFVVDGLGMRQTDWLDLAIAPGVVLTGRFYHSNSRHHTLALVCPPGPPPAKKMHHVMFETLDGDDVGSAFDRAFAAGHPIPNGLGKHDNDKMFSFYTMTPAGFQVEVGYGAREVGNEWNENRAYDSISLWGHQPVGQHPINETPNHVEATS